MNSAPLNTDKIINQISILEGTEGQIQRLKVVYYTSEFEPLALGNSTTGQWRTHDIPVGQYIIGFRCNTNALYGQITKLDFLLGGTKWVPAIDGTFEFGETGDTSGEHEHYFDS